MGFGLGLAAKRDLCLFPIGGDEALSKVSSPKILPEALPTKVGVEVTDLETPDF